MTSRAIPLGAIKLVLPTAISTALIGPSIRKYLHRGDSFDHPNERSSHSVPTPRGGGLACAFGAAFGSATAATIGRPPSDNWLAVSGALGAVGRMDDLVGLSAIPRLGMQAACGAVMGSRVGGLVGAIMGVAIVPLFVNSFNFMDGIDGISGGTAVAWGLCIAADPAQPAHIRSQGCLAAGMGLGFLPFNVPSASMFLGDVGSYLIGAGIAVSVVESAFPDGRFCAATSARVIAPMVPYVADVGCTILRRFLRGATLTEAHREHAYQQLVQETGWVHWKVSSIVVSAAAACGFASRSRKGSLAIAPIAIAYLASPNAARVLKVRSRVGV